MEEDMKVSIHINGKAETYAQGITYKTICENHQEEVEGKIALVMENGKIRELIKRAKDGKNISFITMNDAIGHKAYVRTATFILVKALDDIVGRDKGIQVEFAVGNGYFCSGQKGLIITEDLVAKVKARMEELIAAEIDIKKRSYPTDDAIKVFEKAGLKDKVKLFKYRRSSFINIYDLDGYKDYYYGYMLPNTGYINLFDLQVYKDGMVLILPDKGTHNMLEEFVPQEKLFQTLKKKAKWDTDLGIETVADLNNQICEGKIEDVILVQEALQERRISEIARDIVNRGGVRFVMIAGPSSSGKTSFSHRLSIQLRTLGLRPNPIAVDDYFVNREKTPKDANGDYNFECLEAIDIEQFNKDMCALLAGEEVELPKFNFKTGIREYHGDVKKLSEDEILVIEGIHGLNDKMSYALPVESKYKVYVSALSVLNIDAHNRIPTTDFRLIRRMVRDARTRGASATKTIQMWDSVRKGEAENIFPFQESADAMFNSASVYELSVLKQFAEPLLYSVEKGNPEYYEAKRMLKFFEYFLGVSSESLPNNSIVREFVGGSCFHV